MAPVKFARSAATYGVDLVADPAAKEAALAAKVIRLVFRDDDEHGALKNEKLGDKFGDAEGVKVAAALDHDEEVKVASALDHDEEVKVAAALDHEEEVKVAAALFHEGAQAVGGHCAVKAEAALAALKAEAALRALEAEAALPRRSCFPDVRCSATYAVWARKRRPAPVHVSSGGYNFRPTASRRRRTSAAPIHMKDLGVEPIIWQGLMYVSPVAHSGNSTIDKNNALIVEGYNLISVVLESKQVSAVFSKINDTQDPVRDEIVKAVVGEIRTLCFGLRKEVATLGGIPMNEPMGYWKEKFDLAKF